MNTAERKALLETLKDRFNKNLRRHKDISWERVQAELEDNPAALKSLRAMETTGGEPDVVSHISGSDRIAFCDCSPESPLGRRSLCFDRAALDSRKENKPKGNAQECAAKMGITLLTEDQYRQLQTLGVFDSKTSSWVGTSPDVRALGGALFCDRRYGKVFVYHNGAESYYAARGFRGYFEV